MWQHSHTLIKDDTKIFYGISWFDAISDPTDTADCFGG